MSLQNHVMKKRQANRELIMDEQGCSHMTKEYLLQLCEDTDGCYETPRLNTRLFLHYKGVSYIEHLDEYVGLRALWLENNAIVQISGLERLVELRSLYLQQNQIKKMEGLSTLVNLTNINLAHNFIKKVEGVSELKCLKNIDLSGNLIPTVEDCAELVDLPELSCVDLRNNCIDSKETLLDFFKQFKTVCCLYLRGNPCLRLITMYRRHMINNVPSLGYLDDRPVSEIERLGAEAWARGGPEEETKVRDEYAEAKIALQKANTQRNIKLSEQYKKDRKETFKRMMNELKGGKKEDLVAQRQQLKKEYKELPEEARQKKTVLAGKIQQVEREMKVDFIAKCEERGETVPKVLGNPRVIPGTKAFAEDEKRKEQLKQRQLEMMTAAQRQKYEADAARVEFQRRQDENYIKNYKQSYADIDNKENDPLQQEVEAKEYATSESESDADLPKNKTMEIKDLSQVKWTPKLEAQLEEILISHVFDFKPAAKEFAKLLNQPERQQNSDVYFKVDSKTLQLKWTDIEIRKHVIPGMSKEAANKDFKVEDEEELPPLEKLEESSQVQEETIDTTTGAGNETKVIQYDSSSEDEKTYYNDLEELD